MQHFQIRQSITDRSTDSIRIHLKEIAKYKVLSPEEELELAIKMYNGDKDARETLIKSNLRFVISIAKQYQGKGVELEDLISAGHVGLIKSCDKYNPDLGYRFLSYAGWWIQDFIINEIITYGKTIRIPFNKTMTINKLNKLIMQFEMKHERIPTADELAQLLNVDEEEINDLLNANDTLVSNDLENCNIGYAEETVSNLPELCNFLKSNLTNLEYKVLVKSFGLKGEEMELKEIAKQLGLTTERVRQVKNKAIIKLRKHPNINNLLKLF
jgi:RNA polymerase primary sigma factor